MEITVSDPESEYDMRHLQIHVTGMGCRRCVREVTGRLRDVPGVETVVADAARSQVRLTGTMSLADVLGSFVGSKYGAEEVARPSPRRDG